MTIPFWCLMISCILPLPLSWITAYYRYKQLGKIDNKHPRTQYTRLEGAGARAYAAHQNSWEALIVLAAAVIVAHLCNSDIEKSAIASEIFIVARLIYAVAYITNIDTIRSISYVVGYGCCMYLFYLAAVA